MANGRRRDDWNHTSTLVAQIANAIRDSKKKRSPWLPRDFNPFTKKPKPKTPEQRRAQGSIFIRSMAAAFVPRDK